MQCVSICSGDGCGYHCARVEFIERSEMLCESGRVCVEPRDSIWNGDVDVRGKRDNYYERRTTNETTDKDIELVYCVTFTDSSLTDITSRFRVYKAMNTWTKERV